MASTLFQPKSFDPKQGQLALNISGLCKAFDRPAVIDLDFKVRRGEFYVLLGPNGAGKTTVLRMVTGLLLSDTGHIEVLGMEQSSKAREIKQQVAYLPDEPMLYDKLKPYEYLEFVAGLWGMEATVASDQASRLMNILELEPYANELTEGFSRGMKQKLALAGALIHSPELIILDEPLTGLDAVAARQVKDLLHAHTLSGGTIIMTTHILEVAERLASRIGIIQNGRMIAEGTMDELQVRAGSKDVSLEDVFLALVSTP